jgi:hypothetical protein
MQYIIDEDLSRSEIEIGKSMKRIWIGYMYEEKKGRK